MSTQQTWKIHKLAPGHDFVCVLDAHQLLGGGVFYPEAALGLDPIGIARIDIHPVGVMLNPQAQLHTPVGNVFFPHRALYHFHGKPHTDATDAILIAQAELAAMKDPSFTHFTQSVVLHTSEGVTPC